MGKREKFELSSLFFLKNSLIEFAILHAIVTFLSEIYVVMFADELKPIKFSVIVKLLSNHYVMIVLQISQAK